MTGPAPDVTLACVSLLATASVSVVVPAPSSYLTLVVKVHPKSGILLGFSDNLVLLPNCI